MLPFTLSTTSKLAVFLTEPELTLSLTVRLVLSVICTTAVILPVSLLVTLAEGVTMEPLSTSTVTGVSTPVKAALPEVRAVIVNVTTSAPELGTEVLSATTARSAKVLGVLGLVPVPGSKTEVPESPPPPPQAAKATPSSITPAARHAWRQEGRAHTMDVLISANSCMAAPPRRSLPSPD
ncbi:MAG: hypothetical protein CFE41_00740 [Burkholderiales bacterium PBB2]|nr:MAG: hypothetical protein CFE41_00740 [Burkholderiales bacterium PBB2]